MQNLAEPIPEAEARMQAHLLQLWRKILKTENISIDDDFFEIGGDSLLAMEVSIQLRRDIKKTLPETLLFDASTIRELAKTLAQDIG